jgi:hypothetical protein
MRAALRGIELRKLEVSVHGEVDLSSALGIEGTSLTMKGVRMDIVVGGINVSDAELKEIAEWGATKSTVTSTLREQPTFEVTIA